MFRDYALAALAVVLLAGTPAAGMEHRVGDKTVTQAFPDPTLAALAEAACAGDAATVARLVSSGANPNGAGLDGAVPLFWAIHCENLAGIEALLKAGADPNYRIPGRFTLVYQATTYRNSNILRLLLQHGGNPNTRSGDSDFADSAESGEPAYVPAVRLGARGHWENFELLLGSGLDINRAERNGNTIATELVDVGEYDKAVDILEFGYNHDLNRLGLVVQIIFPMNEQQKRARLRLKAALEQRGVQFPLPEHQGPGKPDKPGEWREW